MGDLNRFYLPDFQSTAFIETGTGQAVGLEYALQFPFKQFHSIEIIPELYEYSKNKITDPRATLHLGSSLNVLKKILPTISKEDRILFWMDSHFPGTDFGIGGRTYLFNEETMPLSKELKIIQELRDTSQDSFIIDDLRLYEDGSFQTGTLDIGKPKSGTGFIEDVFKNTHEFRKNFRDQGYIILTPKI